MQQSLINDIERMLATNKISTYLTFYDEEGWITYFIIADES